MHLTTSKISYQALAASFSKRRRVGRALLVCIDGPGASGKSTVARGLAAASEKIQLVHMDDFYRPSAQRFGGAVAERPIAADFDLSRLRAEVLIPLTSNQPASYHVYDWTADEVAAGAVAVTRPIVVVEGVYSFSLALAPFFDFSVWVECPRSLRLARGLARDGDDARARWEGDWMPGEDLYIAEERPHERAALVCDGAHEDGTAEVVVLLER
jgi:uridine kinase